MWTMQRGVIAAVILAAVVSGCSEKVFSPAGQGRFASPEARATAAGPESRTGAVFLMSNGVARNDILIYAREVDGSVVSVGSYPTGGTGTGGGLGNQASMVLTRDKARLYAVNAGSHSISALAVDGTRLHLIAPPVASGGDTPISLTVHGSLLYVLNAGGDGNIAGFRVGADGSLAPIPGSSRPLGSPAPGPAEIQFTPGGNVLVVTEKATNTITTYAVGPDGTAGDPVTRPAAGDTPFGFAFNQRGDLVVSEAGGGPGGSTASSYRVAAAGVELISGPVATTQSAACWIAMSQDGQFAFTTNTGSGTLSRLDVGPGATLSLDDAVAGVTGPGTLPQDAAFTPGGRFLYVRNANGTIGAFRLDGNGALTLLGNFGPLPDGANGIVAI